MKIHYDGPRIDPADGQETVGKEACPEFKLGDHGLFYRWIRCAFRGEALADGTIAEFCQTCKKEFPPR